MALPSHLFPAISATRTLLYISSINLLDTYLQPGGYGVIAVDDLGYARSSKQTDAMAYALNVMADDLCEILDAEKLDHVISLGHDWGSVLAQRLYNFHPDRVQGLVVMNVAYIYVRTTNKFGWDYGHDDKDPRCTGYGPKILDAHTESAFTAMHGGPSDMDGPFL